MNEGIVVLKVVLFLRILIGKIKSFIDSKAFI